MAFKVTLYSIKDEGSMPQYQSPLSATSSDTYAKFCVFFENEDLVDFGFDFWITGDNKRMLTKFEKFNVIGDEVIVIPLINSASNLSKRRKTTNERGVVLDSDCGLFHF
jgi:hypothetical protein